MLLCAPALPATGTNANPTAAATTAVLGAALWWSTPFTPIQAAGMSAAVVLMGFFGGLVMSAIKRDRGVKDWGHIVDYGFNANEAVASLVGIHDGKYVYSYRGNFNGSPEFATRAKVLKELIEHHIEEEEGELFDKAEEVLGKERLEQMGNKMQELMENPPSNLPEPKLLGGTRKAA